MGVDFGALLGAAGKRGGGVGSFVIGDFGELGCLNGQCRFSC